MGPTWLVGRAGPGDLDPLRRQQMAGWLTSLGLDVTTLALYAAVVRTADGGYELHLAEYVRNDAGSVVRDVARDEPVTRPYVVTIAADSWPGWLTGLGNQPTAGEPAERVSAGGIVLPGRR